MDQSLLQAVSADREPSGWRARARRTFQSRLRRWLRWAAWAGVAGALSLLVLLWGWRYGFSPLPQGRAGQWETNRLFSGVTPDPTNSFWHLLRVTAVQIPVHPGFRSSRYTSDPPEEEQLREWHRAAESALRTVLAASDLRPPTDLQQQDANAFRMLFVSMDGLPPPPDAVTDRQDDWERLLGRWRLQAAVVPASEFFFFFDERGVRQVFDELATPTQARILRSGRLDPERGRTLLDAFASLTNRLGPVEASFLRQVIRDRDFQQSQRVPAWSGVRRSFQMALTLILQDAGMLVEDLLGRALGRRQGGGGPNYSGAGHLLRPVGQLVLALQTWVARPGDFEAAQEASVALTVAALQSGTLPPREARPTWVPGNRSSRAWWRRLLDRPAVWRSLESLPDPYTLLQGDRFWREYLESCRLTLALRLHRDATGAWPERLDELVPTILPALPLDPVTGCEFRYVCWGTGWRLLGPGDSVLAEWAARKSE